MAAKTSQPKSAQAAIRRGIEPPAIKPKAPKRADRPGRPRIDRDAALPKHWLETMMRIAGEGRCDNAIADALDLTIFELRKTIEFSEAFREAYKRADTKRKAWASNLLVDAINGDRSIANQQALQLHLSNTCGYVTDRSRVGGDDEAGSIRYADESGPRTLSDAALIDQCKARGIDPSMLTAAKRKRAKRGSA